MIWNHRISADSASTFQLCRTTKCDSLWRQMKQDHRGAFKFCRQTISIKVTSSKCVSPWCPTPEESDLANFQFGLPENTVKFHLNNQLITISLNLSCWRAGSAFPSSVCSYRVPQNTWRQHLETATDSQEQLGLPPKKRIVAIGYDGLVKIWNPGQMIAVLGKSFFSRLWGRLY